MGKLIKFLVLVVPFLLISYYAIQLTYTTYEHTRDYTPEEAARIAKSLNVGLSDTRPIAIDVKQAGVTFRLPIDYLDTQKLKAV